MLFGSFLSPTICGDKKYDSPKWQIDDSWTYDVEFHINFEREPIIMRFSIATNNLCLRVVEGTKNFYYAELNGRIRITGLAMIEGFPLRFEIRARNIKLSGDMEVKRESLAIHGVSIEFKGFLKVSFIPPLPIKGDASFYFEPDLTLLDFPLEVGKEWSTSSKILKINVSEDLINTILKIGEIIIKLVPADVAEQIEMLLEVLKEMFPFVTSIPELNLECLDRLNVTVDAGKYYTYRISFLDKIYLYYAPDVANFVKATVYSEWAEFFLMLISTTYTDPNAPDKPLPPQGPTRGKIGEKYEYETSTTDPRGLKIQYGWDWNGDGVVDEWTDWHESGEKVKISHVWEKRGNYEIRVKARNKEGLESKWSEPLTVKIRKIMIDIDSFQFFRNCNIIFFLILFFVYL